MTPRMMAYSAIVWASSPQRERIQLKRAISPNRRAPRPAECLVLGIPASAWSAKLFPMRRLLSALVLLLALPASAQAGLPRTAIFFYPWYSNPRHDGQYTHWTQGGHTPPFDLASQFFPMRGRSEERRVGKGRGVLCAT